MYYNVTGGNILITVTGSLNGGSRRSAVTAVSAVAYIKSAALLEYKIATGFEAIFGYLRLIKNEERILELFNLAYPEI